MISFDEFLKQDEADKYNMLQECNAIIQQKENIIKEIRKYIRSKKFEENFPYVLNECQVRSDILKILDKGE